MASDTEICNLAISHLSTGKEIQSLESDRTEEANACRRFYNITRDKVLRDEEWSFATKYITLSLVSEDPNTEWQYAYRLPTDNLRTRKILSGIRNENSSQRVPFVLAQDSQGPILYTDQENAILKYTFRATNPQFYPSDFTLAFSFLLASYIAPRITGGDQFGLGAKAFEKYEAHLSMALENNFNEEQVDNVPDSEIITSRY